MPAAQRAVRDGLSQSERALLAGRPAAEDHRRRLPLGTRVLFRIRTQSATDGGTARIPAAERGSGAQPVSRSVETAQRLAGRSARMAARLYRTSSPKGQRAGYSAARSGTPAVARSPAVGDVLRRRP